MRSRQSRGRGWPSSAPRWRQTGETGELRAGNTPLQPFFKERLASRLDKPENTNAAGSGGRRSSPVQTDMRNPGSNRFLRHPTVGSARHERAHATVAPNRAARTGNRHCASLAGSVRAPAGARRRTGAGEPGGPINRMVVVYVPNGVHMPAWTPAAGRRRFRFALYPGAARAVSKPAERDHAAWPLDKARPHGDGGGDHARSLAAFLTGCQAKKTQGADIRVGVSVDQLAAAADRRADPFRLAGIGLRTGRADRQLRHRL